jgi:cytochrome d ubiquinol oxidase subunit II
MGLFVVVLFTFLASVYLIGETDDEQERNEFVSLASRFYFGLIMAGGLVFAAAEIDKLNLFSLFWQSPVSMISLVLATLLIPIFWWNIRKHHTVMTRLIAGAQTMLILIGWFAIQFPVLVNTVSQDLTIHNAAAPAATQKQLIYALIVGVLIIIPSVVYLFRVFKLKSADEES